jgi:hypothetical protein
MTFAEQGDAWYQTELALMYHHAQVILMGRY